LQPRTSLGLAYSYGTPDNTPSPDNFLVSNFINEYNFTSLRTVSDIDAQSKNIELK
jgi:hypothetical protein